VLDDLAPRFPALDIVCEPPPDGLYEDAWIAMQAGALGEQFVIAVIDGATTRLTPPPLQRHLSSLPERLTPAAFSARTIRDSLVRQIVAGLPPEPRTLALEANADLGRVLLGLFGTLTLDGLGFPDEVRATLDHDPRLVRLGLPASVMTLAVYDPGARTLSYVHAGDTALLVIDTEGRATLPTAVPGQRFGTTLKRIGDDLRDHYPDRTFRDLLTLPPARRLDVNGALFHNYVDEHNLPQPGQGIGVLNGQPELRYFLKTGRIDIDLDRVAAVGVLSDGLMWPASAREVFTDDDEEAAALREQRLVYMIGLIEEVGLRGYLRHLRAAEADDPNHERFPRIKQHDDATGILLWLV